MSTIGLVLPDVSPCSVSGRSQLGVEIRQPLRQKCAPHSEFHLNAEEQCCQSISPGDDTKMASQSSIVLPSDTSSCCVISSMIFSDGIIACT